MSIETNTYQTDRLTHEYEFERDNLESFIPIDRMIGMTRVVLADTGRIDENGQVLPIEVKRRLHGDEWRMGPVVDPIWRTDVFVPTQQELGPYLETDEYGVTTKNRIANPQIDSLLYRSLTGKHEAVLTEEQADAVSRDKTILEGTVANNPSYSLKFSTEQLEDAYHVELMERAEPDFADLRIYVPAGIDGAAVASAVFQADVDVGYAKVWVPRVTTRQQYIRLDTPIFEVTTFTQLSSVMLALRKLAATGHLPAAKAPLVGYSVEDLPGVYIGQTHRGDSFNGRMRRLFGSSIRTACEQVKLHAGEVLDTDTLIKIAENARGFAQKSAEETGTNPDNHAFINDQPVPAILETISQ